jgi:TonB family protein
MKMHCLVKTWLAVLLLSGSLLGGDKRGVKRQVAPIYPELAKRMGVAGVVKLELTVAPNGRVQQVKVVSGHALLRESAAASAKNWIFVETPETTTEEVEVSFALQ